MVDVPHILLLSVYSSTAEFIAYILVNAIITGAIYCTPTLLYVFAKGNKITEKAGKRFVLISCIACWALIIFYQSTTFDKAQTGAAVFFWYAICIGILYSALKKHNKISVKKPVPKLKEDPHSTYIKKEDSSDSNQAVDIVEDSDKSKDVIIEPIEQKTEKDLQIKQYEQDKARYLELIEELKKVPVPKIKQWYAEGKITEEQYRASAQKYNAIRKEMNEIKERIALTNYLSEQNEKQKP